MFTDWKQKRLRRRKEKGLSPWGLFEASKEDPLSKYYDRQPNRIKQHSNK